MSAWSLFHFRNYQMISTTFRFASLH